MFARVSSTSFGGGSLAATRREVVRRNRWLDDETYLDLLAVAQILPGSNPTNLAILIGQRLAGMPGGLAGLLASTFPGFLILMLLGIFALESHQPWVGGALRGCAAMAVGLTLASAIEMTMLRPRIVELAIVIAVAAAVVLAHLSLALTLALFIPVALFCTRQKFVRP